MAKRKPGGDPSIDKAMRALAQKVRRMRKESAALEKQIAKLKAKVPWLAHKKGRS